MLKHLHFSLFSLLYIFLTCLFFSYVRPLCHNHEKLALLQFKDGFNVIKDCKYAGYSNKLASWNAEGESDCCSWNGVHCDAYTGYVTELDLSKNCLFCNSFDSNTSILQLSQLTSLNLEGNNFNYTQIPYELSHLSQLTHLDLSGSNFSGSVPSSLGKLVRLTYLDLSYNNLSGPLPSFLQNLTQLAVVELSANHFSGPIYSWITNLTKLSTLNLLDNQLSGVVDFDIFLRLKYLRELQLSWNKLSVVAKTSYTNVTGLKFQVLGLGFCNLSHFPDFLRYQDKLEVIDLSKNSIVGKMPSWIWNTSTQTLSSLNIFSNFLTGFDQLPVVLPWVSLERLILSHNLIEGPLPVPPSSTILYDLSNNELSGEISPLICNLSSLSVLDLSNNKLTGTVPQCFRDLSESLLVLNISNNYFHGRIPELCGNGSKLEMIDLSFNRFQWQLPRSLANCLMLVVLNLGNNQLDDTFPAWLGNLPKLRMLILRSNRLQGVIRKQDSDIKFSNLHVIDLSHNAFSGLLPSEYFREWNAMKTTCALNSYYMKALERFKAKTISWHSIYDYSVTVTNKGVELLYGKIQLIFVLIDFSSNKFEGEIPTIIGDLRCLLVLNLSNNTLTGSIPSSLGNIMQLESLDLSRNKLSGEIPQQLGQLTFLAFFNVSHNNLRGPIPQGNQLNTFESTSYQGNLGLCGYPLETKCENSQAFEEDHDLGSGIEWDWRTILPGSVAGIVIGVVLERTVTFKKKQGCFV
ncbi:hypothetical protein UlMin_017544 [Ulmus minor]